MQRRQLTNAEKREVIEDQLRETPERSNLSIAQALGVSHPTVARVRRLLEEQGSVVKFTTHIDSTGRDRLETTSENPKLEKLLGRDGKWRPTRYAERKKPEKPKVAGPPPSEPHVGAVRKLPANPETEFANPESVNFTDYGRDGKRSKFRTRIDSTGREQPARKPEKLKVAGPPPLEPQPEPEQEKERRGHETSTNGYVYPVPHG